MIIQSPNIIQELQDQTFELLLQLSTFFYKEIQKEECSPFKWWYLKFIKSFPFNSKPFRPFHSPFSITSSLVLVLFQCQTLGTLNFFTSQIMSCSCLQITSRQSRQFFPTHFSSLCVANSYSFFTL